MTLQPKGKLRIKFAPSVYENDKVYVCIYDNEKTYYGELLN